MPIYYFNLFNDEITMDETGVEFSSEQDARAHAVQEARAMAASAVLEGRLTGSHRIEYVDESRQLVGAVRFDEAVDITP